MFRKIIPAMLILALGLSACSLYISFPGTQPTGPTQTDQISLPMPADKTKTVDMTLAFGAGTMKLHGGTDSLVAGSVTYNIPDFKPTVTASGSSVRIEQGNWHLNGIPNMSVIKNEWDLALGNVPLNLEIEAGAYHAEYHFGGLALTNLTVKDGASETKMDFASPNAAEMTLLRYETGASNVSMTGLANANFDSLEFSSGAGNYTLDFSGTLKHNGSVHLTSGFSNLTLVIPRGVPVELTVDGLSNVSHDSAWSTNGNVYTQEGSGPKLVIVAELGAGNLTLTH